MIVEGALEPRGLVPAGPGGAGHQEIPTAARPQSPQPRDTERHRPAHLCRPITTPASPPRHACDWTHGKISPQSPFSLNLFSFGFGSGFPKSIIPWGLIWVLVLLDADSNCEKIGRLFYFLCDGIKHGRSGGHPTHPLGSMGTRVGG